MATSYEDNFGFWEIACPEERTFFGWFRWPPTHSKGAASSRRCEEPKRPRVGSARPRQRLPLVSSR
jgi:hypothetical protein